MRLDGHTALITGGSQGVGAAIAARLAQAGSHIIIQGLAEDHLAVSTLEACRSHGVDAHFVAADFSAASREQMHAFGQQVVDQLGTPTLLVNNAGTYCDLPFLEMTQELFDRTMGLNVAAGYFLTQFCAQWWIAKNLQGRVLFTGSINGELAEADHSAYDTSKGAVHSMVRSLCVALAPHGIRVNGMAPGLVVTPLTAPVLAGDKEAMRWMQLHTPNGQVPGPEACAAAALFLLSDEASHVQGQMLLVDGGMSAWQQPDLPDALRPGLQ